MSLVGMFLLFLMVPCRVMVSQNRVRLGTGIVDFGDILERRWKRATH